MKESMNMKAQILHYLSRYALSPSCGDAIFLDVEGHCHVESFYLVCESPIREIVRDIAIKEINVGEIQNLAGFMLGGSALASIIVCELKLPCYVYNLENDPQHREVNIRLNEKGNNFALIMGYTTTKKQVTNAVMKIERQGGKVVKVISMIDEEVGAKVVLENKGIDFVSILTLSEIKNEIRELAKQVRKRVSSVEKLLE